MHDPMAHKIARLRDGGAPRVLDLFAGCGGFSLGFHAAGYEPIGALELDPFAARSHGRNFFPDDPVHAQPYDITAIEPEAFIGRLWPGQNAATAVDVIIGGPPCQAFARVGRAKLREIAAHPEAFRQDPRARLYVRYVDYVRALRPLAIVMENVIDILNHGGHNIPQEICETLDDLGYRARYTILNAVHYGVPQMRERLFLVATARELDAEPVFPTPVRRCELARGYYEARRVALKHAESDLFRASNLAAPPEPHPELPEAVTAREALDDLPAIMALDLLEQGKIRKEPGRFTRLMPYPEGRPFGAYGRLMRTWKGFESEAGIYDHLIRFLPRDYKIFRRMQPGDQYPEAHALARVMFEERLAEERAAGHRIREGSERYQELLRQYVPQYDPGKFPNKWRKMEANRPARTLMAHLGKDCYTHIHYDSRQARTISVREAARLQSFPDGFRFEGTMNPALRQIGNAVPPLLARAVAEALLASIRRGVERPAAVGAAR